METDYDAVQLGCNVTLPIGRYQSGTLTRHWSIVPACRIRRPWNVLQDLPRHAWQLGCLAMFTAIRNASSRVSSFALDRRHGGKRRLTEHPKCPLPARMQPRSHPAATFESFGLLCLGVRAGRLVLRGSQTPPPVRCSRPVRYLAGKRMQRA
jgi:hypothetical protein